MAQYDKQLAKQNRSMKAAAVLERLRADLPEVFELAEIVGRWVWITFDGKPAAAVRAYLLELGFHWNRKRGCWQHSGGVFCAQSPGDPRFKYGAVSASALADDAAAVA